MNIHLPATAHLVNIDAFVRALDLKEDDILTLSAHPEWVTVHPMVLALTAAAGARVRARGGAIRSGIGEMRSLPYLVRMGLYRELGIDPPKTVREHEEAGRFIPLTCLTSAAELTKTIADRLGSATALSSSRGKPHPLCVQ